MSRRAFGGLTAGGALALASPVLAAGPYVVDDADITPAGHCQVEAWTSLRRGSGSTGVVAPACTPAGLPHTEFTVTGRRDNGGSFVGFGVKRTLDPGGATPALAVSVQGDWNAHTGEMIALAVNAPLTFRWEERAQAHLNLGGLYDPSARRSQLTYGAAIDARVAPRLTLAAEVHASGDGEVGWQAGLRPHLIAGRLDLDLTVGQPPGSNGRTWITLGLATIF